MKSFQLLSYVASKLLFPKPWHVYQTEDAFFDFIPRGPTRLRGSRPLDAVLLQLAASRIRTYWQPSSSCDSECRYQLWRLGFSVCRPQLAKKVAVPFGDVSLNISGSLPKLLEADSHLVKRAGGPPLTLSGAICKGKKLRELIANALTAGQDARTWTPAEIEQNGWLDLSDTSGYELPEVVERALRSYGTDPAGMENRYVLMSLPFENSQGVTVSLWVLPL